MLEDFAQGIKNQAGAVLTPDAGRIGGVVMLARAADLAAKEAELKVAPMVQGGPLSLLAVARSVSGRDEALWVTSPHQEQWFKDGGAQAPLADDARIPRHFEACEIDESKFEVKRIAEYDTSPRKSNGSSIN